MEFKGIEKNSRIKEIGSIFRRLDGSDWRINVKLQPSQKRENLGVSQLPVLARRRLLNATTEVDPAGYRVSKTINDTAGWSHQRIRNCPIPSVANQEDKDQWCFKFQHEGAIIFLPQIELARTLFFHYSYLSRLAMVPGGLKEEFDILSTVHLNATTINILPASTVPLYVRADDNLRRILAWILLDEDARRSFDSIAKYQLIEGEDKNQHRVWQFRFDPPTLKNVKLTMRGQFDRALNTYFIYEIYGLENLVCNCPEFVEVYDPRFSTGSGIGKAEKIRNSHTPAADPLIDDGQWPSADTEERVIDSPPVTFSFSNPIMTMRKGSDRRRSGRSADGGEAKDDEQDVGQEEVSTDESTIAGNLPAAGFNALDEQSDDFHQYVRRFAAFNAMLERLEEKGCQPLSKAIKKLPEFKNYTKHLLDDGSPRCMSFQLLRKGNQNFALLEVDASGNEKRLSTLVLKQPNSNHDWPVMISMLEQRLLQKSLKWPTKYLNDVFKQAHRRISHPQSTSLNVTLLTPESIQRWADRIDKAMQ